MKHHHMYKFSFFTLLFILLAGCAGPERGALDPEALAKKLFDAVRSDAVDKSNLLLPDKGTYRKIETENGREPVDLNKEYESFTGNALAAFAETVGKTDAWKESSFTRANYTESKLGKLPVARVTTKFLIGSVPSKFEFTAVKFNNRWYYYGDVVWIDKPE